jgi:hypothetical protein
MQSLNRARMQVCSLELFALEVPAQGSSQV